MSGTKDLADFHAAAGNISMSTYSLISLTPSSRIALLDNKTVAQPLENIPYFYETQMLITMKNRPTIFCDVKNLHVFCFFLDNCVV
jgi:hypothetical protein